MWDAATSLDKVKMIFHDQTPSATCMPLGVHIKTHCTMQHRQHIQGIDPSPFGGECTKLDPSDEAVEKFTQ